MLWVIRRELWISTCLQRICHQRMHLYGSSSSLGPREDSLDYLYYHLFFFLSFLICFFFCWIYISRKSQLSCLLIYGVKICHPYFFSYFIEHSIIIPMWNKFVHIFWDPVVWGKSYPLIPFPYAFSDFPKCWFLLWNGLCLPFLSTLAVILLFPDGRASLKTNTKIPSSSTDFFRLLKKWRRQIPWDVWLRVLCITFGFKDIERDEPKGYKYIYSLCGA